MQRTAQKLQLSKLGLPRSVPGEDLDDWIAQAREGYDQEQTRIEGIQQRASFFLGATGLTTTVVLVNGSLLYDGEALMPAGLRVVVGVLLAVATAALAGAAYAALKATMVIVDRARANSAWQIEWRVKEPSSGEESRYVLAATLLAIQRAEAVGDWKVRQLKWARLSFAVAISFLMFASLALSAGLFF